MVNPQQSPDSNNEMLGCALMIGLLVAAIFMVARCSADSPKKQAFRQEVEELGFKQSGEDQVRQGLRDPDSAIFSGSRIGHYNGVRAVCGNVNARNGFGGMTGPQRYVAVPGVISVTEDNMKPKEFEKIWAGAC